MISRPVLTIHTSAIRAIILNAIMFILVVSQRVAAERGEPHGVSAGYQIRLESKMPRPMGSVLYCTTGVLLRRLIGDP